jgi:hypothetical protein
MLDTLVRYTEHIQDIKNNTSNSMFAQHILDNTHSYVSLEGTMGILHIAKRGKYVDALEIYHTKFQNKTYN